MEHRARQGRVESAGHAGQGCRGEVVVVMGNVK